MTPGAIAVVRKTVRVKPMPSEALALFPGDLARWWPLATHSYSGDAGARVTFEGVGGMVIETACDGDASLVPAQFLAWAGEAR